MQTQRTTLYKCLVALLSCLFLVGCFGGSSSSSGGDDDPTTDEPVDDGDNGDDDGNDDDGDGNDDDDDGSGGDPDSGYAGQELTQVTGADSDEMQFIYLEEECFIDDALVSYHDADGNLVETTRSDEEGRVKIAPMPQDGFLGIEVVSEADDFTGARSFHFSADLVEGGQTLAASPSRAEDCSPEFTYEIVVTNEKDFDEIFLFGPNGWSNQKSSDENLLSDIPLNPHAGLEDRTVIVKGEKSDGSERYAHLEIDEVEPDGVYSVTLDQQPETFSWSTQNGPINTAFYQMDLDEGVRDVFSSDVATPFSDDETLGETGTLTTPLKGRAAVFRGELTKDEDDDDLQQTAGRTVAVEADAQSVANVAIPDPESVENIELTDDGFELSYGSDLQSTDDIVNSMTWQQFSGAETTEEGIVFSQFVQVVAYEGARDSYPELEIAEESLRNAQFDEDASPSLITAILTETPVREERLVAQSIFEVNVGSNLEQILFPGDDYRRFQILRTSGQ